MKESISNKAPNQQKPLSFPPNYNGIMRPHGSWPSMSLNLKLPTK